MATINDDQTFEAIENLFKPLSPSRPFNEMGGVMSPDVPYEMDIGNGQIQPVGWVADGVIDGSVHIVPGSIPASAFDSTLRVPTAVDVLPTLPDAAYPEGALVLFLPEGKLYRNVADVWDRSLDAQDMTVGQITADQIEAGSIASTHIASEGITADYIKGGVLVLAPTADVGTQGILVQDALGNTLADWGPNGLKITDPADPARYVLLYSGALAFTTNDGADGFPNAVTPDGINATAINFGSAPGGHNLILNSSFELADFTAAASTNAFTDTAKWAAGNRTVALDNITEGTALTMTTATYA